MRNAFVLMVVVAIAPQIAGAHVVRHNSIPEVYWGTWAPGEGACNAGEKTAFVLSAKGYVGPAGNCSLDYLIETPSPKGSTFSARLMCPGTGAKKTVYNLIFRSETDGGLSAGPTFASLKAHRRCTVSDPAAKK